MGCHSLLQGIFPIQGLNPSSLALAGKDSSTLSHWGSPYKRQMISIYYYFAGLLKKKKLEHTHLLFFKFLFHFVACLEHTFRPAGLDLLISGIYSL